MDSTVDVLSEQPWGMRQYKQKITYTIGSRWRDGRERSFDIPVDAQYMLVRDSSRCYWKRADLIKFRLGYYLGPHREDWRSWFLSEKAYLAYLHTHQFSRNGEIPFYARSEYALIISRYKWKKDKYPAYSKIFNDYGTIVLMLTGSKAGHMRRYYNKIVFDLIARYPYDHIIPAHWNRGVKIPTEVLPRINEAMNNTNGDKDIFILNMIASYQEDGE